MHDKFGYFDEYYVSNRKTSFTIDDSGIIYDDNVLVEIISCKNGDEYSRVEFMVRPTIFSSAVNINVSQLPKGKEVIFHFQTSPPNETLTHPVRRGIPGDYVAYVTWTFLDFNLYASTKKNGKYKRVKTTADFTQSNNLILRYKAKKGKKLYYKIIATGEFNDQNLYSPLNNRSIIGYSYKGERLKDAVPITWKLK